MKTVAPEISWSHQTRIILSTKGIPTAKILQQKLPPFLPATWTPEARCTEGAVSRGREASVQNEQTGKGGKKDFSCQAGE